MWKMYFESNNWLKEPNIWRITKGHYPNRGSNYLISDWHITNRQVGILLNRLEV